MAHETEELWFDEWEHGGHPYYEAPEEYEKWNPLNHVDKWKTPMLVIIGEKGFPHPLYTGFGGLHRAATQVNPIKIAGVPR